jgi:hypothetical protein
VRVNLRHAFAVTLLTAPLVVPVGAGSVPAASVGPPKAIVTVIRHGGLCFPGNECRSVLRIGDSTISGEGYAPRPLKQSERLALLRAVGKLDVSYLRAHPFVGTCPTAYDGSESIYRFRGFARTIKSCTFDVRGVEAVRLTERLLGALRPARP